MDKKLRYEVLAEGFLPYDAYVEPKKVRAPKDGGDSPKKGEGGEAAAEGGEAAEGEKKEGEGEGGEEGGVKSFAVELSLGGEGKGSITFSLEAVTELGGEGGGEGGEGEGDAAAAPAEGEGAEGGEDGENKPKFAKAGLPFTEDDVEEILSVVRYSYLKHESLVECAADPVMHEANAQHLVIKAFSARLAAYEPIHMGELLMC